MGSSYYYLILNTISLTWLVVALICIQTLMGPFHRGFTCGDASINKPYQKNETLPFNNVLVVIVLLLNLAVISCELLRYLIARHCGNTDREKNQLKKWIVSNILQINIPNNCGNEAPCWQSKNTGQSKGNLNIRHNIKAQG